jgi:hypothetical protein
MSEEWDEIKADVKVNLVKLIKGTFSFLHYGWLPLTVLYGVYSEPQLNWADLLPADEPVDGMSMQ